jgi:hypothetical protein
MMSIKIAVLVQKLQHFAELVNFAFWWRYIGKGLSVQPAQQACFFY